MNIYANKGDLVRFMEASIESIRWGGCDDPREILHVDSVYTVEYTEVHSYHTKVKLEGLSGKFNSVQFEDVNEIKIENKKYMVSSELEAFVKTYGTIKGHRFNIEIQLTGLTDILLDELLYWMENRINDRQILICHNKKCINCSPKEWDWELRTCVIAMDCFTDVKEIME